MWHCGEDFFLVPVDEVKIVDIIYRGEADADQPPHERRIIEIRVGLRRQIPDCESEEPIQIVQRFVFREEFPRRHRGVSNRVFRWRIKCRYPDEV